MKKLLVAALLIASSCASTQDDDAPLVATPAPASARSEGTAELQVALTELLEQVDVLNARIARLEASASEPRPVTQRQTAVEPPPSPLVAASRQAPEVPQAVAERPAVERPAPSPSLVAAEIAQAYREAVVLYGKNRFGDARAAFEKVFDREPNGELADNAIFWIGECYFAEKKYPQAMQYYRRVTTEFAQENKAPDAMFKTAMVYERQGDLAMARETLRELVKVYPYSSASASAKRELERIRY